MTENPMETLTRMLELANKDNESLQIRNMASQNQQAQMSSFAQNRDVNIAELQLLLKDELDRIFHLISGHVLSIDKEGNELWVEPNDDRLKILSEYGVKQIMNIVTQYISRNKLLSYYDEDTIKWKVYDFGIELSDLILNRYEAFFFYPKPEELFEKYKPLIRKYNLKISDEDLYTKCIQWSTEELDEKSAHYPMIVLAIVDSIDDTYRRALGGRERESFRKYMHISQNITPTGMPIPQSQPGIIKRLFGG